MDVDGREPDKSTNGALQYPRYAPIRCVQRLEDFADAALVGYEKRQDDRDVSVDGPSF